MYALADGYDHESDFVGTVDGNLLRATGTTRTNNIPNTFMIVFVRKPVNAYEYVFPFLSMNCAVPDPTSNLT